MNVRAEFANNPSSYTLSGFAERQGAWWDKLE
jgi:hypothetical protein